MRRFIALMVLAGCAMPVGNPTPQAARLSSEVLTLTLSDGTVCRANWVAEGGSGRLEPCGPGYGYVVTLVANPNILRQLMAGVAGELGSDGLLSPMAEVVITDPAGIDTVFVSPAPVD